MKLSIQAGSTSQTVNIFVRDSSSTTGGGLTGLVFNTASLTAYYALPKAAAVSITLATLAAVTSAFSSGGFKEVDATNMPGWYRFDIPDAALASGRFVSIHVKGAANMAPLPIEIELTATNNQSASAFITGVNSVAPPTNWNLASIDGSGRVDVGKLAGTSQTARDIGASVLVGDKTGFSLSAAGVQAIWDALTSALTTVGSVGKLLVDNVNATIASRLASASYTAPDNTSITAIKAKTDNLPAAPAAVSDIPTANANADALLDRSAGVETGMTLRQAMRLTIATLVGKASGGATTTMTFRDSTDSKNRVTATVDADGNRTAVTLDAS